MTDLIPPDRERCQAYRPNKTWSPFNLGPADENPVTGEKRGGSRRADRLWQCREPAAFIVTQKEPDPEDGLIGSQSVCKDCFVALCLQAGGTFEVTEDLRAEADR